MLRFVLPIGISLSATTAWCADSVLTIPDTYRIAVAPADAFEKPAAIDGSSYAVIAPTYNNPAASQSYIRLFNGGAADAVFNLTVIGSPSARAYGTAAITVPPDASPQFRIDTLLNMASAPALNGGDTAYALYLKSTEAKAGYQHVTFNGATTLFGNASDCASTLNEVLSSYGTRALTNVHTSRLSAYPSTVYIHNYSSASVTYRVTVVDAGTADSTTGAVRAGSGASMGTKDIQIAPNATYAVPFTFFETAVGWTPSSNQLHANLLVTDPTGTQPYDVLAQSIVNQGLGGEIDMSVACAVNAVSVPTAATATTFAGTLSGSNNQSGTIPVTVQAAVAGATAAPLLEVAQVEKPQATVQASGTLKIGGVTIALSGSYDAISTALSMSGGGYTFTGTLANGALGGSYTGPNSTTGAFSVLNATRYAVTRYCGTWTGDGGSGTFNIQVSASGVITGITNRVTLYGQTTGASFSGESSEHIPFSGTITAPNISGTFGGNGSSGGSFSGSACS